jgi:tRNA (adenine22-N1)-methyltransferase
MNRRLESLYSMINSRIGVIDVGTDHGYLPICLAERGYKGALFASDINAGPLHTAITNARAAHLEERIRFLLCDGLALCPPAEVDTVVIAGMGGDTICSILDAAEWTMEARVQLVLQPMTKAEVLRAWLVSNGYGIEQETLTVDSGTLYQALSARFSGQNTPLSDAECFVGAPALAKDLALYGQLIDVQRKRIETRLRGLESSDRSSDADTIRWYRELLAQFGNIEEALL